MADAISIPEPRRAPTPAGRRGLLAGLGAISMAPAAQATVATDPDAALLAMVAEFLEIDRFADPLIYEQSSLNGGHPRYREIAAVLEQPMERRNALWDAIEVLPARTVAGVRAKARVAITWFILNRDNQPYAEDVLVYGLMRDLLALPGGAA